MNARVRIIGLGVVFVALIFVLVAWLTGGSPLAILASFILAIPIAVWVAKGTGIMPVPPPAETLINMAGIICLLIIGWKTIDRFRDDWRNARNEAELEDAREREHTAVYTGPRGVQPTCRQAFETFDHIGRGGRTFYLRQGWATAPLHGPIKIVFPGGDREVIDYPGVPLELDIAPDGWYTIFPEPLDSERGVQINNCWGNPPEQLQ